MKFKILLIFVSLIIGCTEKKKSFSSLLDYIPQNSSVIVRINNQENFIKALKDNDFIREQSKGTIYKKILKKVKFLNLLNPKTESLLAFSEIGKKHFEYTYITKYTADLIKLDSIENTVETVAYTDKTYKKYTFNNTDNSFAYAIVLDNNAIISSSQLIMENLIRDTESLYVPDELKKLYHISNATKSASFFINNKNCNSLLAPLLREKDTYKPSRFSDWISLDLDIKKDYIKLLGTSIAYHSLKRYVNLFKNTLPLPNTTASFAPKNANAILSYTFNDYNIYAKNQQNYFDQTKSIDPIFNTVEEIGFIYMDSKKAIVLNTFSSESITEFLTPLKTNSMDYQGNEIFSLSSTSFLSDYFNPIIQEYKVSCYTILNNAFVFSSSKEILQTIIRNYKNGTTFKNTSLYKTVEEEMAGESTMLFVSNSDGIAQIIKENFSENIFDDYNKSKLSEYSFASQIVADENFYHTNIIVQKITKKDKNNTIDAIFTVLLESDIVTNPQFVLNHKTDKKEIVVQDQYNNLYLISTKGRILWKKQLNGRIQGEIKQVDLYKNGRLQLAFATDNQFLILDRNGESVAPFNISYNGGNLNALAVFDYDNKKEYRFVITQGSKVFMYNNKGNIVRGFKYTHANSPIITAPNHFRIGKKDYIIFKLENGSLKILNRTGNNRIKVKSNIDFSGNDIYLYKNKFTVTDKKGVLHQIDTKGKLTTVNLNLNKNHGMDATNKTLAIMNDNILSIKGEKVSLDIGVYSKPQIFYINNKIYVSVTDIQNQKVFLFDSSAVLIKNFPIFGASLIDLGNIDNDKNLEIVVKDLNNSLIIYKMGI